MASHTDTNLGPSLAGCSVVYFGNDWFAENRTSSHHIAQRLGQHAPLLYVDCPGMRAPQATARDFKKLWAKLKSGFQSPVPIGPRMWLMTLPQIPFRGLPFVDRVNRFLGVAMLRRALGKIGFRRIVTWFVLPHPGLFAGTLNEEFVIYYCIDHYAALPGVDAPQTNLMDEQLSRVADQIFVASDTLLPAKQKLNSHVMHSPHGVDFDLFSRAADPGEPVAAALRDIPHPVIGFFGVVRDWIDIELLEFIARARPDWTLLIVGMVVSDVGSLKRLSNVIFTGAKPYRDLPQWAKPFDVAIMPYRRTENVAHASPLKLREYLATGKPVVSVSMPLVEQYSEYVYIANEPEAFVRQIERALRDDSPELRERRMRAVAGVTWDSRVANITEFVEREIAARGKHDGSKR